MSRKEMKKEEIKQKANDYSRLYLTDTPAFMDAIKKDAPAYTDEERTKIFTLTEVYINVKTGVITREEGSRKQRQILGG